MNDKRKTMSSGMTYVITIHVYIRKDGYGRSDPKHVSEAMSKVTQYAVNMLARMYYILPHYPLATGGTGLSRSAPHCAIRRSAVS